MQSVLFGSNAVEPSFTAIAPITGCSPTHLPPLLAAVAAEIEALQDKA
ncbi:MAG: hypothetical protein PS018_09245 [bacterium]|nr:hypothetical protein [bacterium]